MKVELGRVAHARSGDKGDASNVGLIADSPALFEVIRREVTAERVREHFHEICRGEVERFEVANLLALNFLLRDSLGGGGTASLLTDAQGKTHGQLLRLEILEFASGRGRGDLLCLTLDDPERANALSPALVEALTAEFRKDWRAEGVRAILLAGRAGTSAPAPTSSTCGGSPTPGRTTTGSSPRACATCSRRSCARRR